MNDHITAAEYRKQHKPRQYPETEIQIAVIEWCRAKGYPFNRIYAIENERSCTPQQAARRKAMGIKSGVSDLFLPIARNGFYSLYIELKSPKGKLSQPQKDFIQESLQEGYFATVCFSVDEAIKVLTDYCK